MRTNDSLTRLSGGEFVLSLCNLNYVESHALCKRVETAIQSFNNSNDKLFDLTFCYGISCNESDQVQSFKDVLNLAGHRMTEFKHMK